MAEIREVLYQHYKGAKQRGIEKSAWFKNYGF